MGSRPPKNGFVIHIGDSFVDSGLQQALRPKFRTMDTKYLSHGKTSAWLSTWANGIDLDNLYFGFRPALFLVTLGANDLFAKPAEKRAPLVREIVRHMHGAPCVWISIPAWPGAPTDMVEMARRESAPCRHFDSSEVSARMTRQADKRHPNTEDGAMWAEAVWAWLQRERDPDRGFWALKPAPPEEHGPRDPATASPSNP